jgi:flagellar hook assembly protein FlgD
MNIEGLIPEIVTIVQSQQQTIQALNQRIDALQELVGACCATVADQRTLKDAGVADQPLETDLRIIPNPVSDQTELRYTLADPGRVRLEITDQTGRVVLTKEEGQRDASAYAYHWDTTSLSPGTYNCALYVNDEQVVRKAVKLAER